MERGELIPKINEEGKAKELQMTRDLKLIHSVSKQLLESSGIESRGIGKLTWLSRLRPKKALVVDSDHPQSLIVKEAINTINPGSETHRPWILISTEPQGEGNENFDLLQVDLGFNDESHSPQREITLRFTTKEAYPWTVTVKKGRFEGNFHKYIRSSPAPVDRIPSLISIFRLLNVKLNNVEHHEKRQH